MDDDKRTLLQRPATKPRRNLRRRYAFQLGPASETATAARDPSPHTRPFRYHGRKDPNDPMSYPFDDPVIRRPAPRQTFLNWLLPVLCLLLGFFVYRFWFDRGTAALDPRPIAARGDLADDEKHSTELFKTSSPSVVYITTLRQARDYRTLSILEIPQGTGSGFIWDDAGHIVTNFHVIQGSLQRGGSATVTLWDHQTYPAKVVGVAPNYDLAILKIDTQASKLRPIPIGESGNLQVGQKVFAIGNPFGLDQSLTTGIVSALGRTINAVTGRPIEDVIQTDAAINPGNSGGPLLDSAGRLIGVNTAIYSPSGAYAGIGFAVPVDTVNRIIPQVLAQGGVTRPYVGVRTSDQISQKITQHMGVPGLLVLAVEPGSPADKAGVTPTRQNQNGDITPGDIIQAIDGKKVTTADQLFAVLERHKAGEEITLQLWFKGQTREAKLMLEPAK
jgi:S1-C subfamily serine protease